MEVAMTDTDFVLGIDVSKASLDVALLGGPKARHARFANSPDGFEALGAWLARWQAGQVHACLEATGAYAEAAAVWLHERGHRVSVVNPARVRAYGDSELLRAKTDRVDAKLIARFCQAQRPRAWAPPDAATRELQALHRRLEALEGMRQQEANRLEGAGGSEAVRESIERHVAYLSEQIEQTRRAIDEQIGASPELKRRCALLETIPGVGRKTAARLLAEVGGLEEYESAKAVVAQAGLAPRPYESGARVRRRARTSKVGRRRARQVLYFPALVAWKHNPAVRALCDRLLERGKPKMVVVVAAMRKLLVLSYGVLKSGEPFDAKRALRA
jgi:transposase